MAALRHPEKCLVRREIFEIIKNGLKERPSVVHIPESTAFSSLTCNDQIPTDHTYQQAATPVTWQNFGIQKSAGSKPATAPAQTFHQSDDPGK
jgi:hypothetical protein